MSEYNEVSFLFSDDLDNPKFFFQGYCFHGSDYIYGEDGGKQFLDATGESIPPGEDGCYVSVRSRGENFLFNTDHHGYKKIFYYWMNGTWIVSNSIYRIQEHMKKRGLPVLPRYEQLAAQVVPGPFFSQLTSFDTIVRGVKLLPAGYSLEVGQNQPPRIHRFTSATLGTDYKNHLRRFCNTWVSRMETLVCDSALTVTADITGGVDSRAVLSMFLKASERLGSREALPQFRCGSIAGDATDLEVAENLSKRFSFPLNQKVGGTRERYTSEEAIEVWRDLSLGCYYPIYVPRTKPSPQIIHFSGGAGGVHRSFYDRKSLYKNIDNFIDSAGNRLEPSWLRHEFSLSLSETFDFILSTGGDVSYQAALIDHYRLFRNRFHAGRSPQYGVVFNPLGSSILDAASHLLGDRLRNSAQVNYDIVASLRPELLDIPFDKDSKNPSRQVLENLTRVQVSEEPSPGRVFIGSQEGPKLKRRSSADLFSKLDTMLNEAVSNEFVREFWDQQLLESAIYISKQASESRKYRHASDAKSISAILASSVFFG